MAADLEHGTDPFTGISIRPDALAFDCAATVFVVLGYAVGETLFDTAIKGWWIAGGFAFAGGAFGVLSLLRLPISLIYGFVRGLSGLPHLLIPEMIGALLARFSLEKRFGVERWRQYAPVLLAGYACGMGLIGMSAVAIALISKSVTQMQY